MSFFGCSIYSFSIISLDSATTKHYAYEANHIYPFLTPPETEAQSPKTFPQTLNPKP